MNMPNNAEPQLLFIPSQDEVLYSPSIDFLSFTLLWVMLYRSTMRRDCLVVLILSVHSHIFDNKLIMTVC